MLTRFKNYLSIAVAGLLLSSCGNSEKDGEAITAVAEESSAVCVWDKAPLLNEASQKEGKWQSSISLGEKMIYLDDTKEDNSSGKPLEFYKVKLLDGKEGFVRSDFAVIGATVATIINKSDIYSRPDLSTLTKKSFEPMDIIAIKSTQGDWTEVIGKRRKGDWIDKGWIKNKGTSSDEKDVAVALYVTRALAKSKVEDVITELKKIAENADLSGSAFEPEIANMLSRLEGPTEEATIENETEVPVEPDTTSAY